MANVLIFIGGCLVGFVIAAVLSAAKCSDCELEIERQRSMKGKTDE